MIELLLFYGLLTIFLVGGVAYSLHLYRKNLNKHEESDSPRAHA